MKSLQLRRTRTRRQRLARRIDYSVGRACWAATAWYGRRLRSALPRPRRR